MQHLLARAEEGIDLDKTIGKLLCVYTIIIRNSQINLFIIDKVLMYIISLVISWHAVVIILVLL